MRCITARSPSSARSASTRRRPERVDIEKVKASLPVGNVTVKAVKGGLDVTDPDNNDPAVIASAAIAVRIPLA
jgi:hypothetical protein